MLTTTSDVPSAPLSMFSPVDLNSSPHKNKKVLLGALVGLIILVAVSVVVFGTNLLGKNKTTNQPASLNFFNLLDSPKPSQITTSVPLSTDSTASWMTYNNLDLLISFRHPSEDLLKETSSETSTITINSTGYDVIIETQIRPDVDISRVAGERYASLNSCSNKSGDLDATPVSDDILTFPGIVAKVYSYRFCTASDTRYHFIYLLAWKDRFYVIQKSFDFDSAGGAFSLGKYDRVSTQILSTFKFLDQSIVSSNTYLACGCGCCSGSTPQNVCLYKSKGDNLEKIIQADAAEKASSQCAVAGCSPGISYKYCD